MRKKIICAGLLLFLTLISIGCEPIYFVDPDLSFDSYKVTEEEITETVYEDIDNDGEKETYDITIGYKYTLTAEIKNEGSPGELIIQLEGQENSYFPYELIGKYGPVNIETGTTSINVEFNSKSKNNNFKIKLFANGNLAKTVEYTVNI